MQDVTDLPFMRLIARYGGPDLFVTEYFRVTPDSKLDATILKSITENETGIPVIAQMIGQDIPALIRTARQLEKYPVAGIDLNLGCPAPVVCRKDAGGGLLRQPARVDEIVGVLRDTIQGRFTVKCRVGFAEKTEFPRLLEVFRKHAINGLTVHGRTVRDAYKTAVHPECVAMAVQAMACPVIANGNVVDVPTGLAYLRQTEAAGLMLGRGAIRHPWLFDDLRAHWEGRSVRRRTGRDMLEYIQALYDMTAAFHPHFETNLHVQKMKRYMVYITTGIAEGQLEYRIRRVTSEPEFFAACHEYLDNDEPLPLRPPEASSVFCGFAELK
ncbi:tRNA-U20a,U20b-dihydrouridine synthase [Prosthecobacter fusiformis]|uniref:tRNA-dihydrouridine synthase n=2 Tax=Prosthecobacter fusiformis TaxID=48464 RepID=A0A4V3FG22_9BACT|nr:tRNA-U20a,U20b-dihydrouridine synthase [Prosthecobacter fusiformis]